MKSLSSTVVNQKALFWAKLSYKFIQIILDKHTFYVKIYHTISMLAFSVGAVSKPHHKRQFMENTRRTL